MGDPIRQTLCEAYLGLSTAGGVQPGAEPLFEGVDHAAPSVGERVPAGGSAGRRLCGLFERLQSRHARRRAGVFYTPEELVRRTVDWTLGDEATAGGTALDPACGGGAFLLELAARLGPEAVHGVDIDPLAVAVARAALTLDFGPLPAVGERVVAGDGLSWQAGRRHTYVVGNPPYGLLSRERGRPFAHLFVRTRPNAFGAFLARSCEWTAPGGRIGLVLPRSIARVAAYEPLRVLLAEMGAVERIVDVGMATEGVGYEQLVVVVRAGGAPGVTEVLRRLPTRKDTLAMTAPQSDVLGGGPIPISLDRAGLDLFRRLQRAGPALGDAADLFRGIGLSVRDPLVSDRPRPGWAPVLRGADVGRDGVRGHAWLNTEGLGDRRFGAKRRRLAKPRIVMPNVVSSLIAANAAWEGEGRLALDTVTNVVAEAGGLSPHGLLAALNSRLGTWLLRHAIFGRARLTNHMDAAYLGRFPLPPPERWELLLDDVDAAYGISDADRRVSTPR